MAQAFSFASDGGGDWNRDVRDCMGMPEQATPDTVDFPVRLSGGRLGPVAVCRLEADSPRVRLRTRQAVEGGPLRAVFQVHGRQCIERPAGRVVLEPGQWCVIDPRSPFRIEADGPVRQLVLLVARNGLPAGAAGVSTAPVRPSDWTGGVSRVLYDSSRATLHALESVAADVREELGVSLLDLARLAMLERLGDAQAVSGRERLRRRIAAYVERHLHDPDLSIERIARSLNCTKRYLHQVFSDGGRTLNAFIRERRLARCRQDLIRPAYAGYSITRISYACGFSSSAHFSRVFRERFGMSPRAYRKRHHGQHGARETG